MKHYKLILKRKANSRVIQEGVITGEDQGVHSYIVLFEKEIPFYNIFVNGEYIDKASTIASAERKAKTYFKAS